MKKKWILANNPHNNNQCDCIQALPNRQWVIVARYRTEEECRDMLEHCNSHFMSKPLAARKMMGMMR